MLGLKRHVSHGSLERAGGVRNGPFKPQATSHELYWSTGDGGPQTDPLNVGQDTSNLLGSMIRIAVPTDGVGYTIPDGNVVGGTWMRPNLHVCNAYADELHCRSINFV